MPLRKYTLLNRQQSDPCPCFPEIIELDVLVQSDVSEPLCDFLHISVGSLESFGRLTVLVLEDNGPKLLALLLKEELGDALSEDDVCLSSCHAIVLVVTVHLTDSKHGIVLAEEDRLI
jgi:hypothetical protein